MRGQTHGAQTAFQFANGGDLCCETIGSDLSRHEWPGAAKPPFKQVGFDTLKEQLQQWQGRLLEPLRVFLWMIACARAVVASCTNAHS